MINLKKLKSIGSEYRKSLGEVDFAGEIEISEESLDELCNSLRENLHFIKHDENLQALLSVVTVNLAYYTREDYNSNSFRWLVLQKLSNSPKKDNKLWEEQFGFPIFRTLQKYFHIENKVGPHRYVRPILEQAGVPVSSINQFLQFFEQLFSKYGYFFSYQNFQDFHNNRKVNSSILNKFLATETGFKYCQEIGRILKNISNNLFTEVEIEELPIRFRETIKEIRKRIGNKSSTDLNKTTRLTIPNLALDRETRRLKLLFSEQAISSSEIRYETKFGDKIYQSSYLLTKDEILDSKFEGVSYQNTKRETWEIPIWKPEQDSWAIFNLSSGIFIRSSGTIEPGEYILVFPDGLQISSLEDYGYLDYQSHHLFKVAHVNLSSEDSIPEIDLIVSGSGESTPQLKISDSYGNLRFSTNVFVGNVPPIEIVNWNSNFEQNYLVIIEEDEKISRLPKEFINNERLTLERDLPAQIQLKIEPKGKARRGFQMSELPLTILPKEFKLEWQQLLFAKEARPTVSITPADKIELVHQNDSVEEMNDGQLQVNPDVSFLELRLKYKPKVSFSLSIPVYRLDLQSDILISGILWQEALDEDSSFSLSFSPNERKQNTELGILVKGEFIKIYDTKTVPNDLQLKISNYEIKDAFEDCKIVSGLIAVKTYGGRIVCSDIQYINDSLAAKKSDEDTDEEFDSWISTLPKHLRTELEERRKRHIFIEYESRVTPVQGIPKGLDDRLRNHKPSFNKIRQPLRVFSEACRNQKWQTAGKTKIGSNSDNVRRVTDAVRVYHTGIEALNQGRKRKYLRCVEGTYHSLNRITQDDHKTILGEVAVFLKILCCIRLDEIELANELSNLLSNYWKNIIKLIDGKIGNERQQDEVSGELFIFKDVLLHEEDLDFILKK